MEIFQSRRIHCVGIGGIGVSAIARLFKAQRKFVSGSDLVSSVLIQKLIEEGIGITIGHNVSVQADVLVYSPAVPYDNPERVSAREQGIIEMSYPEVLGEISRFRPTIAVSGMHGKSTTTAMLGLIMEDAGFDPLVIVGSQVPQFGGSNVRVGEGVFVVEACEYRGHMNFLSPQMIVITNIEEEHLDFYEGIEHIRKTFQEFVLRLPKDGKLVRLQRDAIVNPLMSTIDEEQFDTGVLDQLDVCLKVPGDHNRENASAAATAARVWGVEDTAIKSGLERFTGIWRRFESVGSYDDVEVISDYGHHPTEIAATLSAARERFPAKRLLLVFQPHQYDRTKKLFDDFVDVLAHWDGVVVSDVYDVAGREESKDVGSHELFVAIDSSMKWFGGDLDETEDLVRSLAGQFDVIVVMGAGTIDRVARNISQKE